jgi:hypothetical protein
MVRLPTRKATASQNRMDGVGSRGNRLQCFPFATPAASFAIGGNSDSSADKIEPPVREVAHAPDRGLAFELAVEGLQRSSRGCLSQRADAREAHGDAGSVPRRRPHSRRSRLWSTAGGKASPFLRRKRKQGNTLAKLPADVLK